jgi:hypothetical protein
MGLALIVLTVQGFIDDENGGMSRNRIANRQNGKG